MKAHLWYTMNNDHFVIRALVEVELDDLKNPLVSVLWKHLEDNDCTMDNVLVEIVGDYFVGDTSSFIALVKSPGAADEVYAGHIEWED